MDRVVIGLDVGEKRIGVAIGDTETRIARPSNPIRNDETIVPNIEKLISECETTTIIVGLPRNMDGSETDQSKYIRKFADDISKKINVQIIFQDESLTSVIAEQNLRMRKDFSELMLRDGTLDSAAAALILSDYLENNGGEG